MLASEVQRFLPNISAVHSHLKKLIRCLPSMSHSHLFIQIPFPKKTLTKSSDLSPFSPPFRFTWVRSASSEGSRTQPTAGRALPSRARHPLFDEQSKDGKKQNIWQRTWISLGKKYVPVSVPKGTTELQLHTEKDTEVPARATGRNGRTNRRSTADTCRAMAE